MQRATPVVIPTLQNPRQKANDRDGSINRIDELRPVLRILGISSTRSGPGTLKWMQAWFLSCAVAVVNLATTRGVSQHQLGWYGSACSGFGCRVGRTSTKLRQDEYGRGLDVQYVHFPSGLRNETPSVCRKAKKEVSTSVCLDSVTRSNTIRQALGVLNTVRQPPPCR